MGYYDIYFGGIVLKFSTEEGAVLFNWQSDLAFDLKDSLEKAGEILSQRPPVRPEEPPPSESIPVEQSDFESLSGESNVANWSLNVRDNDLVMTTKTASGRTQSLSLPFWLMRQMQDLLQQVFDRTFLIDLRPYRSMSWPDIGRVLGKKSGYILRYKVTGFELAHEIYRRNTNELVKHLQSMSGQLSDDQTRWDRRFLMDQALLDAIHYIFNFVASAKALAELSRSFYRIVYQPDQLMPEYQAEIDKRFKDNGLVSFVHKLRDLILHVSMIGLIRRQRFDFEHGIIGSVTMGRDDALVWDGWSVIGRKWLQSQPDEIRILDVVLAYNAEIEDFHKWYREARERTHWKEYREAELLRRAGLARRGVEQFPELWKLLEGHHTAKTVRETFANWMTSEETYSLREHEHDMAQWLPKALVYAQRKSFIPLDVSSALLGKFASGSSSTHTQTTEGSS